MALVWREKNPGATDEEIKAFEEKEQLVLPEGYKAFLREMDGGYVELGHYVAYFDQRLGNTIVGISEFYSIRETIFGNQPSELPHEWQDLIDAFGGRDNLPVYPKHPLSLSIIRRNIKNQIEDEDFFPNDILYVVHTDGGHEGIVLLLGTEEVYLWFDYKPKVLLASTFEDFLRVVRSGEWNEEDVI